MRQWIPAFICAAGTCFAGEANSHACVGLYTEFANQPAATLVQAIQSEVESIWAPAGLKFLWKPLARAQLGEVFARHVLLRFHGYCAAAASSPDHARRVFGRTHTSNGQVLPFCDIECDDVRSAINPFLRRTSPQKRDLLYGTAIGRVVAHELCHVFSQSVRHGSNGIFQVRLSARELITGDFRLRSLDYSTLTTGISPVNRSEAGDRPCE